MQNHQPKKFTKILILWNFGFALFSLVALLRTAPDLFYALSRSDNGFYHSVCSRYAKNKNAILMDFTCIFFTVKDNQYPTRFGHGSVLYLKL
jgi:hypothetical protein